MSQRNITRRNLVKMGGVAAAGAAGATITASALADEAKKGDLTWAKEAEIVVLGTGASGLTAAITAAPANTGQ